METKSWIQIRFDGEILEGKISATALYAEERKGGRKRTVSVSQEIAKEDAEKLKPLLAELLEKSTKSIKAHAAMGASEVLRVAMNRGEIDSK